MVLGISFNEQLEKSGLKRKKNHGQAFELDLGDSYYADNESGNTVNDVKIYSFIFLFFVLTIFIVGRLFFLQVIEGEKYRLLAKENSVFVLNKEAPRGVIYDSQGKILAKSKPGFSAVLNGSALPKGESQVKEEEKLIENLLNLESGELEEKIREAKANPSFGVVLKGNISYDTQLTLETLKDRLSGIEIKENILRDYPLKESFSHLLGYTGEISGEELKEERFSSYHSGSIIGRSGLEEALESDLRGKEGKVYYQMDALGRLGDKLRTDSPQGGHNVHLTVDSDLSERAGQVLSSYIKKYKATGGVFIAQNPQTGQILSLISQPSFDNNLLVSEIKPSDYQNLTSDPLRPLFNRATLGLYPPGSVIKPAVALAALENGIITVKTKIDDLPQIIQIGPYRFADWRVAWGKSAYGPMDVNTAIAQSSDTFFYKIGGGYENIKGLGPEKIKTALQLFGLGEVTNAGISPESPGVLPDPLWKKDQRGEPWYLGDSYHLAIGQGDLLVTPIQIANYVATLANGGTLYQPQLVERITDEKGKELKKLTPKVVRANFFSQDKIDLIRKALRLAVSEGIVYPLRNNKVAVAAKTGTAEFGTLNAQNQYNTHAWVMGFAPFDKPLISFVLLLESGGASSNAAEAANEILNWYFSR